MKLLLLFGTIARTLGAKVLELPAHVAVSTFSAVGVDGDAVQCSNTCISKGVKRKDSTCCGGGGQEDKSCPKPARFRCNAAPSPPANAKPNIVFALTDDLGTWLDGQLSFHSLKLSKIYFIMLTSDDHVFTCSLVHHSIDLQWLREHFLTYVTFNSVF